MTAQKPIIHGRDHGNGGADPVPGLLPSTAGDWPANILALPGLRGYWRLGEGAPPYADMSGYNPSNPADLGVNAGTSGSTPMTQDVTPGLLPTGQDDGAVAFNQEGVDVSAPVRVFLEDLDASSIVNFDFSSTHPEMSVIARVKPAATTNSFWGGVISVIRAHNGPPAWMDGWVLQVRFPTMEVEFFRGSSSGSQLAATSPPITAGQEYTIAGTYDGATTRLYVNGALAASVADVTNIPVPAAGNSIRIGGYDFAIAGTGDNWRPFLGVIDEVAVFGTTLSDADVAALHKAATGVGEDWVLTIGPDGTPTWQPPTGVIDVTHGGGTPDPTPVVGTSTGSGPTSSSGWHLDTHFEYAVLYDSQPARFDVPSRKWVRVPFNTARIWRRWEPTVGGFWQEAWLPDDRGLTSQAKNGLFHVTAGMQAPQTVEGWYTIEYPVLDPAGLPDFGTVGLTDAYVRAGRLHNVTDGVILRLPGLPTYRAFMQWEFYNDADGVPAGGPYGWDGTDNPYPIYPIAPARPLTLPAPYPAYSPVTSLDYYTTVLGDPGFTWGNLNVTASLSAGDNICLEAWQDTPWLLRFSTNRFPNWGVPPPYNLPWRNQPFLALRYSYDPETINHTTGALL